MQPTILFRKDFDSEGELEIAKKYFNVVEHRAACPPNALIIPRYSALPYYRELEKDIVWNGGRLLNTYAQHRWIADFDYYSSLRDFTPESWDDYTFCDAPEGKFVVKGKTNSRKHDWNKLMFAPNKAQAANIACELLKDSLIGPQGVVYRRYVPLKTFEIGLNDLPFTNEWRFFFYKNTLLSYGYYWSSADEEVVNKARIAEEAIVKARDIATICSEHVRFFVLDMAETESGDWILIEVNDGQMSGLSENAPALLYYSLNKQFH